MLTCQKMWLPWCGEVATAAPPPGPVGLALLVVLFAASQSANALGQMRALVTPPVERVVASIDNGATVWAQERLLYGVDGLKVDAVGGHFGVGRFRLGVTGAQLGAPIGSETLFGGSVAVGSERASMRLSVAAEQFTADGAGGSSLVTMAATTTAMLSERTTAVVEWSGYRVAGERYPGVDVVAGIRVRAHPMATVVVGADIDRRAGADLFAAVSSDIYDRYRVTTAYDGLARESAFSLSGRFGHVGVAATARLHAVLGVSQGIRVSWFAQS